MLPRKNQHFGLAAADSELMVADGIRAGSIRT
jgi:hypothetical protein